MKSIFIMIVGTTIGFLLYNWSIGKLHFPPVSSKCMTLEEYRLSQQTYPNCVIIPIQKVATK